MTAESRKRSGHGGRPHAWRLDDRLRRERGHHARFTIATRRRLYFIKFDPARQSRDGDRRRGDLHQFLHALGYHVPENYIARSAPTTFVSAAAQRYEARTARPRDRPVRPRVGAVRSARKEDGTYRVVASKALPGTPVGQFRYHSTRPDDPERHLRMNTGASCAACRVFAAWLNHDETRERQLRSIRRDAKGRQIVRHHLIDFGSTLGSGSTAPRSPAPATSTSGRHGRRHHHAHLRLVRSALDRGEVPRPAPVGRFEAAYFTPERWKPNTRSRRSKMRPDDGFWAARLLAAFDDELIPRGGEESANSAIRTPPPTWPKP